MSSAAVLLTRTSLRNAPLATAGMSIASGGGVVFGVGETACTTLTERFVFTAVVSTRARRDCDDDGLIVMVSVASLLPSGSVSGLEVTSTTMPPAGTTPLDGEIVTNGLFDVTVNASPVAAMLVAPSSPPIFSSLCTTCGRSAGVAPMTLE